MNVIENINDIILLQRYLVYNTYMHIKSKALRITLIVLSFLFIIFIILGSVILFNTLPSLRKDDYQGVTFSSWMKYINDDTLIKDIVIPGSHDAGTDGMFYMGRTQKYSVKDQLERGVRYFDIRVTKENNDLFIFHSILNGQRFENIADEVVEFVKNNPTEFLILDFQHFKNDSYNDVFNMIEEKIDSSYFITNNTNLSDEDYINQLTIKDARGKVLFTIGKDQSEIDRDYHFIRDKDSIRRDNSIMRSFYESNENKKSSKKFIEQSLPLYLEKRKQDLDGLFVLQAQLTDGLFIFGPGYKENTHTQNVYNYLESLKESENLKYLNIIMRDFLDIHKSAQIISLNAYKENNISTSSINEFNKILEKYL